MNSEVELPFFKVELETVPDYQLGGTSKKTAQKAAQILVESKQGFQVPTPQQRRWLLIAFAEIGLTLYGKAFDIIKTREKSDLDSIEAIRTGMKYIVICEIKSTNRKNVKSNFEGFFFSLSTAELLTAQNLKTRYKFLLVNTLNNTFKELELKEIYRHSKGIYPSWSIQF